jgi:hypothetical protein
MTIVLKPGKYVKKKIKNCRTVWIYWEKSITIFYLEQEAQ